MHIFMFASKILKLSCKSMIQFFFISDTNNFCWLFIHEKRIVRIKSQNVTFHSICYAIADALCLILFCIFAFFTQLFWMALNNCTVIRGDFVTHSSCFSIVLFHFALYICHNDCGIWKIIFSCSLFQRSILIFCCTAVWICALLLRYHIKYTQTGEWFAIW